MYVYGIYMRAIYMHAIYMYMQDEWVMIHAVDALTNAFDNLVQFNQIWIVYSHFSDRFNFRLV